MKLPNIVVRMLAGVVFVSLLIGGILINEYTFGAVFALVTGLALYEFYGLMQKDAKVQLSRWFNVLGGVVLFGCSWWYGYLFSTLKSEPPHKDLNIFIPYGIFLLILFVSELYAKRENPIKSLAYAILGQIYIAIPFSLLNVLAFFTGGLSIHQWTIVLSIFVFIWVNDSFAYLTGMAFGKHRLFERISPKKSWEGFIGGSIFAMASSYVFYHFDTTNSYPLYFWIGLAAVTVAFGTWGDLIESLMKRTLGVKDSGKMIPGHGGILDRFDSTIFAVPAAVIYVMVMKMFI